MNKNTTLKTIANGEYVKSLDISVNTVKINTTKSFERSFKFDTEAKTALMRDFLKSYGLETELGGENND